MFEQITQRNILRVLIVGFTLVILLLLTVGFISVRNLRWIKESAAGLVEEQLTTSSLIDEIQGEQGTLSEVFYNLGRDPHSIDRKKILSQLDEADRNIDRIVTSASRTAEDPQWIDFKRAYTAFSSEARRLLLLADTPTLTSRDLIRSHEEVTSLVSLLVAANYARANKAQNDINMRSEELIAKSLMLLGAGLLFAVICAILTVRMTAELSRKMEWQGSELSRVSWHMLENQETTARRFSHELHDEMGQSLTAIKANLMALSGANGADESRVEDCVRLVDEAVRNVRELSQLLRPTILDDFGLDAGLRWLCEGFKQRTRIDVEYSSNFVGRLVDETETHLFRIAQEALTNVARHSEASKVWMQLQTQKNEILLSIDDNGRGLQPHEAAEPEGLGMIGMRARARSAGGELSVRSVSGKGVSVEVRVPVHADVYAKKDSNPVGR